jgi:hypothetical protein
MTYWEQHAEDGEESGKAVPFPGALTEAAPFDKDDDNEEAAAAVGASEEAAE